MSTRRSPGRPADRRSARPCGRAPVTQTSTTSGPSMVLTSPPTTAHPTAAAARQSPRWISSTSSTCSATTRAQRGHAVERPCPHRREVGHCHREGPDAEGVRADPGAAEVDVLDERVDAGGEVAARRRDPDRRVVAAARRGRERLAGDGHEPVEKEPLTDLGEGGAARAEDALRAGREGVGHRRPYCTDPPAAGRAVRLAHLHSPPPTHYRAAGRRGPHPALIRQSQGPGRREREGTYCGVLRNFCRSSSAAVLF